LQLGIDIYSQESKTLERYLGEPFDYVVTVCDEANEACPFFRGAAKRLHRSLPDPAAAEGTEEDRLEFFRSVRKRLRNRIEGELLNE
jgi:arsenate reductase